MGQKGQAIKLQRRGVMCNCILDCFSFLYDTILIFFCSDEMRKLKQYCRFFVDWHTSILFMVFVIEISNLKISLYVNFSC